MWTWVLIPPLDLKPPWQLASSSILSSFSSNWFAPCDWCGCICERIDLHHVFVVIVHGLVASSTKCNSICICFQYQTMRCSDDRRKTRSSLFEQVIDSCDSDGYFDGSCHDDCKIELLTIFRWQEAKNYLRFIFLTGFGDARDDLWCAFWIRMKFDTTKMTVVWMNSYVLSYWWGLTQIALISGPIFKKFTNSNRLRKQIINFRACRQIGTELKHSGRGTAQSYVNSRQPFEGLEECRLNWRYLCTRWRRAEAQ